MQTKSDILFIKEPPDPPSGSPPKIIHTHKTINIIKTCIKKIPNLKTQNKNLYVQSTTIHNNNTIGHRIINADLILSGRHHQRDLFTGSLGIPDVNTHVGSVIHAFETMARTRQHATDVAAAAAEQPYEVSTGSVSQTSPFKHSIESKTLSKHNSGTENRQKLVVITVPPPPPPQHRRQHQPPPQQQHRSRNLRRRDSFSRTPSPPMPPDVMMHLSYELGSHTLPHARHSTPAEVPASTAAMPVSTGTQTMRRGGSGDANSNSIDGVPASVAVVAAGNHKAIGYMRTIEPGHHIDSIEPESSNFDSINMDDYRRNLFGPQPKVDSKFQHLADMNGKDAERQQKQIMTASATQVPNESRLAMRTTAATSMAETMAHHHSANNGKLRERSGRPTEVYLVKNDNNYMVAEHTLPHNYHQTNNNTSHNINRHNFNNNSQNSNNLINRNINGNQNAGRLDANSNFNNDDEQALLRGTTVSQSFIKNVKIPRKISDNSSTSNGFRRNYMRSSAPSPNRSYWNSTSTFKPTSDLTDELRIRYTEHNAETITAKRNQNNTCALHPNRLTAMSSTSVGTTGRRHKS